MKNSKKVKVPKKETSLKEMILNIKKDNLEFKEQNNFEETLTKLAKKQNKKDKNMNLFKMKLTLFDFI